MHEAHNLLAHLVETRCLPYMNAAYAAAGERVLIVQTVTNSCSPVLTYPFRCADWSGTSA